MTIRNFIVDVFYSLRKNSNKQRTRTQMNDIAQAAVASVIAFVSVFITSVLTTRVSPVVGAVVWASPISITILLAVYYFNNDDVGVSHRLLMSAAILLVPLIVVCLIWSLCMTKVFHKRDMLTRYWASFGVAMAAWVVIVAIILVLAYTNSGAHSLLVA
jgi:hypothetical protein